MKRTLINIVAFQAGWFACVIGAAKGMPWAGPLVVGMVVCLHLAIAGRPERELKLIFIAMFLGLLFDSLLVLSGWLRYAGSAPLSVMAPYWIVAMWALFATTLNVSMRWLKGRPGLASLMGAIFGPISYMAGQRLGALDFLDFNAGTAALVFIWAVAMPLLLVAANHFDGFSRPEPRLPLQSLTRG